jgi:hypothetical protein
MDMYSPSTLSSPSEALRICHQINFVSIHEEDNDNGNSGQSYRSSILVVQYLEEV